MDTCFSLFTNSTSPYSPRRLGPRDRQTSAVLTYTLHLPRVCAVLRPPQQGIIFPPKKAYRLINPRYPPWNRGWCSLSLKIVSSLSRRVSAKLSVSTEKKNRIAAAASPLLPLTPIQAVGGNHFRPLSLDPRRTSFDPHRFRSLPSLPLSFGQLDGRLSSSLLSLLCSSLSETSFPPIGHHPLFRGISRYYCCLGLGSRPLP